MSEAVNFPRFGRTATVSRSASNTGARVANAGARPVPEQVGHLMWFIRESESCARVTHKNYFHFILGESFFLRAGPLAHRGKCALRVPAHPHEKTSCRCFFFACARRGSECRPEFWEQSLSARMVLVSPAGFSFMKFTQEQPVPAWFVVNMCNRWSASKLDRTDKPTVLFHSFADAYAFAVEMAKQHRLGDYAIFECIGRVVSDPTNPPGKRGLKKVKKAKAPALV